MHNYSFHPMSKWVVNGFTKNCKGPPPHFEGCIHFFHHIKLTSESITEIGLSWACAWLSSRMSLFW